MKLNIFNFIEKKKAHLSKAEIKISFDSFIEYLRKRTESTKALNTSFLKEVLHKLEDAIERNGEVELGNLEKFEDELSDIYKCLTSPIADETETFWALAMPFGQCLFYGTDPFYDLLKERYCDVNDMLGPNGDMLKSDDSYNRLLYSLILEKLYGFKFNQKHEIIRSLPDTKTGLLTYYRVNIDSRFIDVELHEELPDLNYNEFKDHSSDSFNWKDLQERLPLQNFIFKGFSILTVDDVTISQSLEDIKNLIIHGKEKDSIYEQLTLSLKRIVGHPDVEFGIVPFLKINERIVFEPSTQRNSIILDLLRNSEIPPERIDNLIDQYLISPEILFFNTGKLPTHDDENVSNLFRGLVVSNIKSYALLPVYHNSEPVGALEIYTKQENLLDENLLVKLSDVPPLLGQILRDNAVDFEGNIDDIIKEKFTSLQPAVQWKFNEKAWEYKKRIIPEQPKPIIEDIKFEHVYPLYGAIDIRNSTIERNAAASADLSIQLNLLHDTLLKLRDCIDIAFLEELIHVCENWLEKVESEMLSSIELTISDFLNKDVPETLRYFKTHEPNAKEIIRAYEDALLPETGEVFKNRRSLESSIRLINTAVNSYLEMFNDEIQGTYPCYFEKFRSDGVEYDIYIGQSIAPKKPFNILYLKNIRLWQLTSMAAIGKVTYSLIDQMETPLQTTQLIFVNSSPIDISFRIDERRFDVEGAYNIRYEMVKKRIDKVCIKGTNERLTQPGKIALVYFSPKEIREFRNSISYLQKKGMLLNDLEDLELEELQGVNGLRALRVGIQLEPSKQD
ncbi:GAF domain-containing protein [Albibacterium profundi]|uniref:GAF domain-containing protein n=1 Tax=Albibacterium profundi TaxID=3134906 RepID=A0ABV5CHN3_9SPHI